MLISLISVAKQVFILFILIGIGFLCAKRKVFSESSIKNLTTFILFFVTPCVIVNSFHRDFDPALGKKLLICLGCAVLQHGINILLATFLIRDKDRARRNVMQYGTVFSNCGYMALPLQNALLGSEGVFLGAVYIAVFNLLTWTYGIALMSGDRKEITLKKIILNPGVLGVLAGLILFLTPITLPEVILSPIQHLAALNTPLPMIVIGFYLAQITSFQMLKDKYLLLSITLRMIITPIIGLGIMYLLGIRGIPLVAMCIAATAPTAANTTMFAARFDKDTKIGVSMVTFSTLVSIVTMPLIVSFAMKLAGL